MDLDFNMKITDNDKQAVLDALGMFGQLYSQGQQSELAELEANRNRQHKTDTLMLQHGLTLHAAATARQNKLSDELNALGIPYNDVESDSSKQLIEELGDIKMNNLKSVTADTERLTAKNAQYADSIASYRRGEAIGKLADINADGTSSIEEINAYLLANPKLTETYNPDILRSGMEQNALTIQEQTALDASKAGIAASAQQVEASKASILASETKMDYDIKIGDLSYSEQITKMHREPLTALELEGDSYSKAVTGYSGKLNSMIYDQFNTATNSELAEWSEEGFQESDERVRYDPDQGMYTYNDAKYMDTYIKKQAKQLAIENQFNELQIGLTPEDIANETEQYKVFESKFIKTATDALKANPEYKATGMAEYTALQSTVNELVSKDPEIIKAQAELNNIGPQVTALFTTTDGDETEISSDAVDTIEAKLKAAGTPLSEKKIQKYLNDVLAFSGSPMTMRKLLVENPDFQTIISATGSLGEEYVKLLQRLDREIDRKSPFVPGIIENQNLLNQTRSLWDQAKQP